MPVFARLREILNRPVEVRSREFPVWQIAVASTVAVFGAISLIRRFTRPTYGFYTTGTPNIVLHLKSTIVIPKKIHKIHKIHKNPAI